MVARSTTVRDRDRAVIRRGKPPCHLCGGEIDYTLRSPDPGSFEVDHIVPLTRGGIDELANKAASHLACNRSKGSRMPADYLPRTFITTRSW